jgi:acetyltransferase-like isoleucine patch superfamily enzyme
MNSGKTKYFMPVRKLIHFAKRVFVRLRSVIYVFYYGLYYGVQFGKGVRIYEKLIINGFGNVQVGENTHFGSKTILSTTNEKARIIIGKNCFINGTIFFAAQSISVGDNCITSDCEIMDTSSRGIEPDKRNDPTAVKIAPIELSENVWIGSKVIILPGAKVLRNSIIGVTSVVTGLIPENVFAAGIPARVIKKI